MLPPAFMIEPPHLKSMRTKKRKMSVIIYGIDGCPFVEKALQAYGKRACYYDVMKDQSKFLEMLQHPTGARQVPVIVEDGNATLGFGGSYRIPML